MRGKVKKDRFLRLIVDGHLEAIASSVCRILLLTNEPNVARAKLVQGILEASIRNKTALTEGKFSLTDVLTVSTGAAETGFTVRVGMTTRTFTSRNISFRT